MSYANKISSVRGIRYVKMFVLSEYGRFTFIATVGVSIMFGMLRKMLDLKKTT